MSGDERVKTTCTLFIGLHTTPEKKSVSGISMGLFKGNGPKVRWGCGGCDFNSLCFVGHLFKDTRSKMYGCSQQTLTYISKLMSREALDETRSTDKYL